MPARVAVVPRRWAQLRRIVGCVVGALLPLGSLGGCETDRDRAQALIAEAHAELAAGHRLEARETLSRATELDPTDHDAWSALAELYLEGGGWRDADVAAGRAIAISGSARDHEIRARAALAEERWADAERAAGRALELGGPEAPLRELLARAQEDESREQQARSVEPVAAPAPTEPAIEAPAPDTAPAPIDAAPEVTIDATVRGALELAAVQRVTARLVPGMRACIANAAARGVRVTGDVTIVASVAGSGRAQHAIAVGAMDDRARDCVTEAVSRTEFPEARGTTRVILVVRPRRD